MVTIFERPMHEANGKIVYNDTGRAASKADAAAFRKEQRRLKKQSRDCARGIEMAINGEDLEK